MENNKNVTIQDNNFNNIEEEETSVNNAAKNKRDASSYRALKSRLKGHTLLYLKFPIYFSLAFTPILAMLVFKDFDTAVLFGYGWITYIVFAVGIYLYERKKYIKDLVDFAEDYSQMQKELIKGIELPYGIVDSDGTILWGNTVLGDMTGDFTNKSLKNIFEDINLDIIKFDKEDKNNDEENVEKSDKVSTYINYNDKFYRIDFVKLTFDNDYLVAMYMFDETEIRRLTKENVEQKMVAGLIYLDNYDDALESVEDVRRSLLIALIDRKINKYFSAYDAVVRKLEKDKYFVAIKQKYVSVLQSNKFSILDEVKNVNIGNEMAVTISIGLGVNGDEYTQNCEYSRIAIDLALGRGGDQAVVKDGDKIYFYGGKSKQVEKSTRVKARVKAHALRELMEAREKILIMGHKIGDIDSLGSAIGIYKAAKLINKQAFIIINEITASVRPMIDILNEEEDYEEVFIDSEKARELVDQNTAVVVVDVSRPSLVECPEILSRCKSVVILDHHRRSSDIIENAQLSYIEPSASSASEMVAEILQYFADGIKLRPAEAEAMYAGMMIDTNNFSKNTGSKTFEAAAFLRKSGADVTHVRKLFRDSFDVYKAKAAAIASAEVFLDVYSIAVCPSEEIESPTEIGAQISNELLNIRGIKAAFVLTEYNGRIYVSARSMGDVNVQLIMEKLGGGGHLDTAGAQLENVYIDEAKKIVKDTVIQMIENKEV